MPRPKVYAIIRGNGDFLVASGGRVGNSQTVRKGWHLPGGTYDGQDKNAIKDALREVKEETGIELLEKDCIDKFTLTLNRTQVTFVVFEVFSVSDMIGGRTIPPTVNPYDEPFATLSSMRSSADCLNDPGFSAEYGTDWFAKGLMYAFDNKLL